MQNCKESAGQRIIFTGPDGFGDYRPRSNQSPNVGMGALSPGATSDLSYLWRAAPAAPPPLPKNGYVGEKSITRMEVEAQASSKFLQQSKKMTTMQKTQNRD
ncbi:protein SPMIP2 isoform 2-T2 [Syngnathus typhle]